MRPVSPKLASASFSTVNPSRSLIISTPEEEKGSDLDHQLQDVKECNRTSVCFADELF